jgi:hypothetical protein
MVEVDVMLLKRGLGGELSIKANIEAEREPVVQ